MRKQPRATNAAERGNLAGSLEKLTGGQTPMGERAEHEREILGAERGPRLELGMEHPDLQLRSRRAAPHLTAEQQERRQVVFEMLVSLFERAYLLAFDDDMTEKQRRRWHSWDDYMREWCRRPDFCAMLPQLLEGEDPDFVECIQRIAKEERGCAECRVNRSSDQVRSDINADHTASDSGVRWKERLDPQLLQRDVARRAERHDGAEQPQLHVADLEMNR